MDNKTKHKWIKEMSEWKKWVDAMNRENMFIDEIKMKSEWRRQLSVWVRGLWLNNWEKNT